MTSASWTQPEHVISFIIPLTTCVTRVESVEDGQLIKFKTNDMFLLVLELALLLKICF